MTRKRYEPNRMQGFSDKKGGLISVKTRPPFWFPASNYYVLAFAISVAVFMLCWGVLHEGNEEVPWIPSGIAASILLGGAAVLRQLILKKARDRYFLHQKRLARNFNGFGASPANVNEDKLTLERNAEIINQIKHKSEAAKVLKNLSDAHREVFETCNEYLSVNKKALETVGVGSPRLAALRRGREIIGQIHRFHLLTWAGIESRQLTYEAKNRIKISDKLNSAQKAQSVIESALQFYPNETQLLESEEALGEYVASIKISHFIEQAERAAFKENYKRAISLYRDALFFLAREKVPIQDRQAIAEKISSEIEKIRQTEGNSFKAESITEKSSRKNKNTNDKPKMS